MGLFDDIEQVAKCAEEIISQQRRRRRIRIYAEGLKAKLWQAQYALDRAGELAGLSDTSVSSTEPHRPPFDKSCAFYCDSFWTFLDSSLDVLGQFLNQALHFDLDEQHVYFHQAANRIKQESSRFAALDQEMKCLKASDAFKNLRKYRNCSTHRRQICIEERTRRRTPGYASSSGGAPEEVVRILCDNPLALTPSFRQNREIPAYMDKTQSRIHKAICDILATVEPVK